MTYQTILRAWIAALIAFYALGTPWAAGAFTSLPPIPAGCTVVGRVTEGFPLAHCADGSWMYQDLDGSDGSLGTEGDGRWLDASGYVERG
jgi:hypothetical protein